MFQYDITDRLQKKLGKLAKKDKVLAKNFYKKLQEVISHNKQSINTYKNLKSPKNQYKRVHLTDNYILLFAVEKNKIVFVEIMHWDNVYK